MQKNTARRKTGHQAGRAAYHLSARVLATGILRAWGEETHRQQHPARGWKGGSCVKREGKGNTRTCREDGGVPSLCWRPGKAGPGSMGRESGKKTTWETSVLGKSGRERPGPEPWQPHTQRLCRRPRAEPIPVPSPASSPARVVPTQGLEELQQLQQ